MRSKSIAKFAVVALIGCVASAAHATYVGNPLVTTPNIDGSPPLVILGQTTPTTPAASSTIVLPAGVISDVKIYTDAGTHNFTVYDASPASPSAGNEQFTLTSIGSFTTTGTAGIETFSVTPFTTAAGDLLAFWGAGPTYSTSGNDVPYGGNGSAAWYQANQPTSGATYSVGVGNGSNFSASTATYQSLANQVRTYSIGVDLTASPVPEPASFALLGFAGLGLLARRRRA